MGKDSRRRIFSNEELAIEKAAFQSVYSFISPVDKTEKFSALIGVLTPFLTGLQVVRWSKATLLWYFF